MQLLELGEHDRQHRAARARSTRRSRAVRQLALGLVAELGEQLLLQREQPLRAPVEPAARLGRLDAAARAVEELQAEPLLERADLQAHRRLGDAELLRRLREAPPLDDRAERRELTRVHKQSLCMETAASQGSSIIPDRGHVHPRLPAAGARDAGPAARRRCSAALDLPLSALFLLVALPIARADRARRRSRRAARPVLYRGERVGRGGRVFTMLKFRTLRADAETRLGPYLGEELVRRTEDEFTPSASG